MKRFSLALLFSLLIGAASAQLSGGLMFPGPGMPASAGGGGRSCVDDTASTNFLARTSGLSNARQDIACTLIKALESAGAITGNLSGANGCGGVLEAFYFPALDTAANAASTTTAKLNWCGTNFTLVQNGSLTFTADIGYTGDGSTAFLDTQYTPNTNAINLSLNNAGLFAYIQSTTAVNNGVVMGAGTNANNFLYLDPVAGSAFFWEINGNSFPSVANTNPQGAWLSSRNGSSSTTNLYKNGSTTPFGTSGADTSTALNINSIYILALNNAGGGNFVDYQVSAAAILSGSTATQSAAIENAVNAAMTTLGHAVY